MANHRTIVARGFIVTGWLVGLPSLAAFVGLSLNALALRRLAAPDGSHMLSVHKYGLVGLLTNGAVGVDRTLGFLAGGAAWVLGALAVAALAAAIWAALVWLTGRGLARAAGWARVLGGVIAGGLLLIGLGGVSVAGGHAVVVVPALVSGAGLYVLWVVIWRFRDRGEGAS